jgi:E3 ubiquitin-protein ligase MYCBP2
VAPDSAGGRLAAWIQPESRLDPNRCELKLFQDPIQSGWPTKFQIETRDQYGEIVYVPNIKIQLKVALSSNFSNEKRYSKMCKEQNMFMPLGKVSYEPVIKEKEKICLKSITAMKAYAQYSFEELRMYTPVQNKTSDLMTAKDSGDQTYSVIWTPETAGNYVINIIIDSVQVNENYNVTVVSANVPPPVKEHALKKIQPQYKYRKYYAEYTSGLRIRLHPTLQADVIGIIKVNDVISFIDEVENSDGVWVKLSTDSIRKYCSSSWYPSEAWCLSYNKHFDKRLLFSLIESNSESSTANPTDDMNNVKFFDDSEYYSIEESSELQVTSNFEDAKLLEDDDEKPPTFEDAVVESSVEKTNQSNITDVIAGVVEGGANKLQAFQKWLKRDSIGDTTATIRKRIGSIPEVYNNNTLDLKNLNTNNVADKLSNDINLTSPVQENIIPTNKISKMTESQTERFKNTNPFKSSTNMSKNLKNLEYEEINTPKQALSPSVAETIRAIFAAFLWHEGLVHDAIACASFLKFHPSINKSNVYGMEQTLVHEQRHHETLTKEEKIQQRHSVEITNTSNYLNARPSTLEALTKSGYCCVHYRKQRGKHAELSASEDFGAHGCPPALKCLIFVWDELNKDFQGFVGRLMNEKEGKDVTVMPKSNVAVVNPNDVNEIEFQKNKLKAKKFADEGNTAIGAVGGGSEHTVWCELCDADINPGNQQNPYQQNAFTQHLKSSHPGCGESAKGKGYNSNGMYCEGWAGQCGEEGVGATSWYLLCETCRDKYMVPHKKSLNVNDSLLARAASQEPKFVPPTVNPSAFGPKKTKLSSNMSMEFFDTMKDNALFLLDLNSHNGGLLNKSTGNNLMPLKNKVTMRHSSAGDFVIQPNTSSFSHRHSANVITDDNLRRASLQKQSSITNYFAKKFPGNGINGTNETAPDLLWTPPESITCLDMLNAKLSESESCNAFSVDNEKNFYDPLLIPGHQQQNNNQQNTNELSKFHRSFSMIQGWGLYTHINHPIEKDLSNLECAGGSQFAQNNGDTVVRRRKKPCLCDSSKFLVFK